MQVPSAFEYAWQVVTHDLVYKSEDIDWRKARLVAQLKAAVEQIELIIAGFQANVSFVAESSFPELEAKQKIITVFKDLIEEGTVSRALIPHRWSRFGENIYNLVKSYSKNGSVVPRNVDALLEAVTSHLQETGSSRELMSGSLHQVVLGCINAGIIQLPVTLDNRPASLSNFAIIDSSELRDFHGVRKVPRPFDFDH